MKVLNPLKNCGYTLDQLYENKAQILVNLSDKPHQYTLILNSSYVVDKIMPDCKLSSFSANLWTRTKKGMNYERYKSLSSLQSAIVKLIKSRIDTQGDIEFGITTQICLI